MSISERQSESAERQWLETRRKCVLPGVQRASPGGNGHWRSANGNRRGANGERRASVPQSETPMDIGDAPMDFSEAPIGFAESPMCFGEAPMAFGEPSIHQGATPLTEIRSLIRPDERSAGAVHGGVLMHQALSRCRIQEIGVIWTNSRRCKAIGLPSALAACIDSEQLIGVVEATVMRLSNRSRV